jgi:hypothetical protein
VEEGQNELNSHCPIDTCRNPTLHEVPLRQQTLLGLPLLEMMSSSFRTMAAPSRHASPRKSHCTYEHIDTQPAPNEYEAERDRRKKALHDRVQLALLASGFPEAATLQAAFSGEGTLRTRALGTRKRRQKRTSTAASEKPRRSACNVRKNVTAVTSTTISPGEPRKVSPCPYLKTFMVRILL